MKDDLEGRKVLITGASGGIGLAIAKLFAAEGCSLVLHYHQGRDALSELSSSVKVPCLVLGADLRSEEETSELFLQVAREWGGLDCVVACAGVWVPEVVPLAEMSFEQWRSTMASDLDSVFLTCREYLRLLQQSPCDDPAIVLVGSTAALFGEAGHADYSAAKAAMVYGLTRSLKNEIVQVAPRGRVNCVCPGWTHTKMAEPYLADKELVRRATSTMALQKVATPEDVARSVYFLSSPEWSGHVSGEIITVAGGMEGRLLHGP